MHRFALIIKILILFFVAGCSSPKIVFQKKLSVHETGDIFYKNVLGKSRIDRESIAKNLILSGNVPDFMKKFSVIKIDTSINNQKFRIKIYVLPDYLSAGTNKNFARIPLTPETAQEIADSFHCFLPTKLIVDYIYQHAKVRLEPVPMYAFRDSSVTMYQHNLIIEGQRRLRKGLIAGIKKDIVITSELEEKPGKVAIYGWHHLNGIPIQPLYTGHASWYVDYSHGVRLIFDKIKINGKWHYYIDILKDPILQKLITTETNTRFYRYP
ncbi:MAG: hypothetical protein J0H55_00085 [Chitinophagaceae bacterium]|nr:hypothetical protein [Chitinophagaceae bacterium]